MSNTKTNKRAPNSNSRFLGTSKKQLEVVFDYRIEELESTALESVFEELFSRVRKQFDDIDK